MKLLHHARRICLSLKYMMPRITDKFEKAAFSIKILFHPVTYPELNTIEMIWYSVQREVAARLMNSHLNVDE